MRQGRGADAVARPRIKDNIDFGGDPDGPPHGLSVLAHTAKSGAVRAVDTVSRVIQPHELDLIRRTAGLSILDDPAKIAAVVEAMDAIREQTGKILRSGVQIGRELIALLERLSAEEGQKIVRAGSELFAGWTAGNLTKMIGAARLFDSGWVDKSLLPTSYTVLYQLSQIDRPLLEHAVERDLIRPDLSRTDVEELRRTITIDAAPARATQELVPELARIDGRIAELRRELRALAARRRKLMAASHRPSRSDTL